MPETVTPGSKVVRNNIVYVGGGHKMLNAAGLTSMPSQLPSRLPKLPLGTGQHTPVSGAGTAAGKVIIKALGYKPCDVY
ncbi:MAG: hypothetical protein MZV63_01540 [Marinilabiliales bacterium]|nr:hypothetical protein [Marinilabiliales bacterium]